MRLYRAVSTAELADIRKQGGTFRDSKHLSGEKGFFFSLKAAQKFAARIMEMTAEEHQVVYTDAPDLVVSSGRQHKAAQEGSGVYLRVSDLDQLSRATEV